MAAMASRLQAAEASSRSAQARLAELQEATGRAQHQRDAEALDAQRAVQNQADALAGELSAERVASLAIRYYTRPRLVVVWLLLRSVAVIHRVWASDMGHVHNSYRIRSTFAFLSPSRVPQSLLLYGYTSCFPVHVGVGILGGGVSPTRLSTR